MSGEKPGVRALDKQTWLIIGDPSWTDYTVEFDADASDCWWPSDGGNVVALRVTDLDNMIAFRWVDCQTAWYIVEDGKWQEVPNTKGDGIKYGMVRLTITVQGDRFSASVGDKRLSSFFDKRFQRGKMGLRLDAETIIDNLVVRSVAE